MRSVLLAIIAVLFLAAPPGLVAGSKKSTAPSKHFVQTGMASWYGNEFKGRRTASGERYRPDELTAAHRTLPFDTYVRVTNLRNNRSVIVRINNRGPHMRRRIIDVSRAAARRLKMTKTGVAPVRIEVVEQARSSRGRPR